MTDREKDNIIRSFTQADISISPVGTEDITVKPWQMEDTTDTLDPDEEIQCLHGCRNCQVRSIIISAWNISVQTRDLIHQYSRYNNLLS